MTEREKERERLTELIQQMQDRGERTIGLQTHIVFNKNLADHLLANGVIVPPCKVGDKIYKIWSCGKHGKSIAEFTVSHIDIDYLPDIEIAFTKNIGITGYYYFAKLCDIGKTVFLTKEEAEQALKERTEK